MNHIDTLSATVHTLFRFLSCLPDVLSFFLSQDTTCLLRLLLVMAASQIFLVWDPVLDLGCSEEYWTGIL